MQQQAEQYLGTAIDPLEWDDARAYAEHKLKKIIEREGDADGARREPWYLAQLIAETVRSNRFSGLKKRGKRQPKPIARYDEEGKLLASLREYEVPQEG